MKKILFMLCLFMTFIKVNALTFEGDNVITQKGVTITKEEYEYLSKDTTDYLLDRIDYKVIDCMLNGNVESKTYYIVTTYEYRQGKIINSYETETNEETAKYIAQNENYYLDKKGNMSYQNPMLQSSEKTYSTDSKVVHLDYYRESDKRYVIKIWGEWYKMPQIRQFDIVAARWDVSNSQTTIYATQMSDAKSTFYDGNSNNINRASNGLGLSMNLHDNAKNYLTYELIIYSDSSFGNEVYGTYQHAKHSNANTLAISKSYTFRSDGLGGVVYFSNSKYRSYYDGMKGLTW